MAINAIQAEIRSMTGTERQFNGDLHAYWDQLGIPPGQFAERMVAWKQLPQNAAWIAATEDADAPEVVDGLWKNGEQGVEFDASDLSTMFQDAAGTLPVYAPGQGQVDPPVGLWLDKRKGLIRGPELLTNGDFSSGSASWGVANNDATHTATFASGALQFKVDSLTPALTLSQLSVMTPGKWYEVTLVVTAWTSGTIKTDAFAQASAVLASGPGTFTTRLLAASSVFSFTRGTPTVDITIDSISVRELPGNHAYQTTTTGRPTLSARYNLLTGSEQLSGAGWSVVAADSVSLTRTSGYPSPAGEPNAARLDFSSTATGEYCILRQIATVVSGVHMRPSIWLRADTPTTVYVRRGDQSGYDAFLVTSDWAQFFPTSGAATSSTHNFDIGLKNSSSGASGAATIYAWGADLRAANDGVGLPSYQRVVDANTYDTAGFPLYLRFDGVDDFLQTSNVDFSGTDKIFFASALRKLSDASSGIVVELTTNSSNFSGTFMLAAPSANGVNKFRFSSKGTVQADAATTASTYSAPYGAIVACSGNIGGAAASLRVNGAVAAASSAAQGTGNFTSAVLYIGRRGDATTAFNGRLYSLLIRGAATPDATITKVERYLNQNARIY